MKMVVYKDNKEFFSYEIPIGDQRTETECLVDFADTLIEMAENVEAMSLKTGKFNEGVEIGTKEGYRRAMSDLYEFSIEKMKDNVL